MIETDQQLVERIKSGDRQAFELIVERYHQRVIRFLVTLLGNSEDAHDVAQDTFVKAYQHLSSLRAEASLAAWLFRIAHRLGMNRARANKVKSRWHATTDPETRATQDTDLDSSPHEAFSQSELKQAVTQTIRRLPGEYSTVVWLRFSEEMKVTDIANALGLTRAATESRLRRGTRLLREELLRVFPELREESKNEMQHSPKTHIQAS